MAQQVSHVNVSNLVLEAISNGSLVGLPSEWNFDGNRLYFLARNPTSELFFVDVPSSFTNKGDQIPCLEWQRLVDPQVLATDLNSELPKEEQLRRERMRAATFGLTSYSYNRHKKLILFSTARNLYIVNVKDVPRIPQQLESHIRFASDVPIDPSFSPDASFVAFIRYNDIWVNHIQSGKEIRLTWSNPENASLSKFTSGVAEFIMQEEFDRMTGYWWNPKIHNSRYQIAYFEVDLSQVLVYKIPQPGITGEVDEYLYPLAGTPNALSNICIVEFDATNLNDLKPTVKRLLPSLKERFPWMEYVPRCEWSPDGKKVCVQLLDRQQQHLLYIAIDQNEFREDTTPLTQIHSMSGIQILKEETTSVWINIHDLTYHYDDGSGRILFASETTGFRHLYLLSPPSQERTSDRYHVRAITQGDSWQVDDDILVVDEKRELVYFMGTKDSPLEKHLYVASTALNAVPTKISRLTPAGFWHDVTFEKEKTERFVSVFSNVKQNFKVQIFQIVYSDNEKELPSKAVAIYDVRLPNELLAPLSVSFPISPPEFFDFVSSRGEKIFGCFYKPPNYEHNKRYPTVLYVYGGPHMQLVTNQYKITRNMKNQLLASLGYVVVMIDGVGSFRRGLKFEGYIRCRMGTVEVQDQVEGLQYLIAKGLVDPARIAVFGWSYGGYMSLLCLAQKPQIFKMAISGAPVTLWEAYDTGYTERYMDTPQANATGYLTGSVLTYADRFPNEPNRLMIAHGAIDENVHICHSYQLVQKLINLKKPFVFLVYPEERHGLTK
jgi:dipeptidyl-peptidase 9